MKRCEPHFEILFWCRMISHFMLITVAFLTQCISLKTVALPFVSNSYFISMYTCKSHAHFINRNILAQFPSYWSNEIYPLEKGTNFPVGERITGWYCKQGILQSKKSFELLVATNSIHF